MLYSGGFCFLFLAAFYAVLDVMRRAVLGVPAPGHRHEFDRRVLHGTVSVDGFIASNLKIHLGKRLFAILGEPYEPLLHGAAMLLVLWLILFWMYRRKLFLRI